MLPFDSEERPSDSPVVEKVWRAQSNRPGSFTSPATSHWEMVVTQHNGQTSVTMRGPETKATPADCPANTTFFGIVFKLGVFIPRLPISDLRDRNDLTLPGASGQSFWLFDSVWQLPTYDNADVFVNRMLRRDLLVRDSIVEQVLREGYAPDVSIRTVQRRFVKATGITQSTFHQIERARRAECLLKHGVSILDAVEQAGYADQPHLTRSLKRFVGQTPAQILHNAQPV